MIVFLFFIFLSVSAAQQCKNHWLSLNPRLTERFSFKQLEELCKSRMVSDQQQNMVEKPKLSAEQAGWLQSIWSCHDFECICVPGRKCKKQMASEMRSRDETVVRENDFRSIRKEYRRLTDQERRRFHKAMNRLKSIFIGDKSQYDLLIHFHSPRMSPGAHQGAAFLPFHRELVQQLEVALKQVDPLVAVPYWDSTLDQPLPNPTHSILWTLEFFGNDKGEVVQGPFANWQTFNIDPQVQLSDRNVLVRDAGATGGLLTHADIQMVMNMTSFAQLTMCVDPYFELVHGLVHLWVGGHMGPLWTSPNDPAFFLLHAHVDKIWEDFRQTKQTREHRENDYVPDGVNGAGTCFPAHNALVQMKPFNMLNIDGLSNRYTDVLYQYEPSPMCSRAQPDCGSPYLFCQASRCISKVRMGGDCSGFENSNICFGGRCVNGQCRQVLEESKKPERPISQPRKGFRLFTLRPEFVSIIKRGRIRAPNGARVTPTPTEPPRKTVQPRPTIPPKVVQIPSNPRIPEENSVWFPITIMDTNSQPITSGVQIQTRNIDGVVLGGSLGPSDQTFKPFYPGFAYARVPNPRVWGRVEARVIVLEQSTGSACTSYCAETDGTFGRCEATLVFDPKNEAVSSKFRFTPFRAQTPYLNWDGENKIQDPFLFVCDMNS